MQRVYSSIIIGMASLCLVFFVVLSAQAQTPETVPLVVKDAGKAAMFNYIDEEGQTHTLDVSKSKLTALHFWATWCVPCVDELPMVDDTSKIFASKGLQVVAIALDGKRMDKVQAFLKSHKIEALTPYLDPTQKTVKLAVLQGLPGTLFIDNKGMIVARADGPLDWQQKSVEEFLKARLK